MYIIDDQINNLPFQPYHKTALLQVRPLTGTDYQLRNGVIYTREGPVGFEPGDYLAQGNESEEWPITKEHFVRSYERVSELNSEGFAFYYAKDICLACQIPEPFMVKRFRGDILIGKAGDYLVRSGDHIWIADHNFFEGSYEMLYNK